MPKRKKKPNQSNPTPEATPGKGEWVKQVISLKADHNWKSKPGYKIFVLDRGSVRFDVPSDWIFEPKEKSFRFIDGKPPDDNACLEVSFNRLPPHDWGVFPLEATLQQIMEQDKRQVIERGEIISFKRQTARIVWTEIKYIDKKEQREAYSRTCVGLGSNVQCLITFDYWADHAEKMLPVWEEAIGTLTLGLYIRDPRTGAAFPD